MQTLPVEEHSQRQGSSLELEDLEETIRHVCISRSADDRAWAGQKAR